MLGTRSGSIALRSMVVAAQDPQGDGPAAAPARASPLAVLPDAGARSLKGSLAAAGHALEPINLGRAWGDAVRGLPAIHLVLGLAKRRLAGTHQSAAGLRHLQAYLEELVLRLDRRPIGQGFARLVGHAVHARPVTDRGLVDGVAA
jgi:hypothetical protein